MSAISVLGDPVETYKFGAVYWMTGFGCSLAFPLVAHVFAPYYHKLKIISAYEVGTHVFHVFLLQLVVKLSVVVCYCDMTQFLI